MIPYGKQHLTDADIESVVAVLRSDFLTQGPLVPRFEDQVARRVGANFAVATNSATSALHVACLALGLGNGDLLWTTPNTFVASANCGLLCGAEVSFVDIEETTGLMCTQDLRRRLVSAKKKGRLPKIVVPVHLSGSSCDMEEIATLSKEFGFRVIEDASHAIGGSHKGHNVGSCKFCDIAVFSFHPVKIITSGEGGMACTNKQELASSMKLLRSHGITKDKREFISEKIEPWTYEQQCLGLNYRMTDIHAALGISQLERLDDIVKKRTRAYLDYKELLKHLPVKLLEVPKQTESSFHLVVALIQGFTADQHRFIFTSLRERGIGVQLHYSPVHLQPYFQLLGFKKKDYPIAEAYASKAISLPIFERITFEEQAKVTACFEAALKTADLMN